jgi:predicted transposase/invertase (TIGR01784 family)
MGKALQATYDDGKVIGEIRGRAEGEAKGRAETALNMFNLGLPIELIAQATKFSVEELEKLKGDICRKG